MLGERQLNKITTGVLERFYADLLKNGRLVHCDIFGEGLSVNMVRSIHRLLVSILTTAKENDLIKVNPGTKARIPIQHKASKKIFTIDELRKIFCVAKEKGLYELMLFALCTGMERGELCALQWKDIRLKNGEVKILLDGLILSNGFEWSIDEKRFYHTDSDTKIIKEYSFNKESGEISFTGRSVVVPGVDGFTVDQNDLLYVACWGKGHIAVINTVDMQIIKYIEVPAKIPASCGFAGKDMEHFVVVSATFGTDLEKDKNAGYTFICDVKAKGRKPYLFG